MAWFRCGRGWQAGRAVEADGRELSVGRVWDAFRRGGPCAGAEGDREWAQTLAGLGAFRSSRL